MGYKFDGVASASAGINRLLDASGPQDEYFLEYVNRAPSLQCIFSCNISHIREGLKVSPKGRTSVIDAVYLALNAMQKAHHASRALLVVSDGYDNASVYNSGELERAWPDLAVPIFLVSPVVPGDVRRPETPLQSRESVAREALVRIADRSGGFAVGVSTKEEMILAVEQVAAAIRSPYTLYFQRPATSTRLPRDLRVKVYGVKPHPTLSYGNLIRYTE